MITDEELRQSLDNLFREKILSGDKKYIYLIRKYLGQKYIDKVISDNNKKPTDLDQNCSSRKSQDNN